MSASPSPTTSDQAPSPTQSTAPPQPTESGVHIPTSTVVAIGGGFVCFALLVLGILLTIRLIRLFIAARRDRTPFLEAWRTQGGFFGWIHGVGPRDREADAANGYLAWLPGGGGWYAQEVARMRMWNEMARAGRGEKHLELWDGDVPSMWEVALDPSQCQGRGGRLAGESDPAFEGSSQDLASYQPFSLGRIDKPDKETKDPPRTPQANVRVSVLIALPSPDSDRNRLSLDSGDGDEFEIPEMAMGSMVFTPTVKGTAPRRRKEGTSKKSEVRHVEDRNCEVRQAEWVRVGDNWVIEGLDGSDVDSDKGR